MSNPLNLPDLIYPSRDWLKAGMCVGSEIDMTPGPEGEHAYRGEDVMLAKSNCMNCLVKDVCLKDALGDTERAEGVRGALTGVERERLRVGEQMLDDQTRVLVCSNCGQDCVPLDVNNTECDSCVAEVGGGKSPELFKRNIIGMIGDNHSYKEIADRFKLSRDAVAKACNRWGHRSRPGPRNLGVSGAVELAPCGTPAAIRRHNRRGESRADCACGRPGAWNHLKTRANQWGAAA